MHPKHAYSTMKALSALTACAMFTAPATAIAQTENRPLSRAEVKAETRAAAKAGLLIPAGEGYTPRPQGAEVRSTKTRAQRKAETLLARKAGELEPAGQAGELKHERAEAQIKSTKSRADRKAETLAAAKAHLLTPAGEGPGNMAK